MCTSFFFVLTLALLCLNVRLATNFAFEQEMFLLSHIANYACMHSSIYKYRLGDLCIEMCGEQCV